MAVVDAVFFDLCVLAALAVLVVVVEVVAIFESFAAANIGRATTVRRAEANSFFIDFLLV